MHFVPCFAEKSALLFFLPVPLFADWRTFIVSFPDKRGEAFSWFLHVHCFLSPLLTSFQKLSFSLHILKKEYSVIWSFMIIFSFEVEFIICLWLTDIVLMFFSAWGCREEDVSILTSSFLHTAVICALFEMSYLYSIEEVIWAPIDVSRM